MKVRTERLETLRVAHAHASGDKPEDDAYKKLMEWAERKGLSKKGARLFGRNTYPTNKPEPHGYEFFLTVGQDVKPEGDIDISEVSGGLYAVLRFTNLDGIGEAWQQLWHLIEESKYKHVGWKKGEHGWVNGFEEHLSWRENKPTNEWVFDLWVQLKE
jgi:DNA gyrase inhibitor GyrI